MKHPEITATHLHATETANQTLKKVSEVPAAYATKKKTKTNKTLRTSFNCLANCSANPRLQITRAGTTLYSIRRNFYLED